jgi:hypothetical protein
MAITWVLEKDVFSERCFGEMISHFKTKNIPHHVVRVVPFIHEIEGRVPEIQNQIVVYGSIGSQKIALHNNWLPGIWTGAELDEVELRDRLGNDYLNSDAVVLQLKDISLNFTGDVFMKPNGDTKEFAGCVQHTKDITEWVSKLEKMGYAENLPELDVVVSTPKRIGCEWRIVVVDKKISSYSCYKQYGIVKPERWMPNEVFSFVDEIIAKYSPFDVFVLDVCQLETGEFKVIEYNTFNSAGLYECDVSKIIDDINEFLERK